MPGKQRGGLGVLLGGPLLAGHTAPATLAPPALPLLKESLKAHLRYAAAALV